MLKFLRWFLFVIVGVLIVELYGWLLNLALFNVALLSKLWIAVIMLAGYSVIIGLAFAVIAPAMSVPIMLAPRKSVGAWIMIALSGLAFIYDCFLYAQFIQDMSFSVFGSILLYLNLVFFWGLFIGGLGAFVNEEV